MFKRTLLVLFIFIFFINENILVQSKKLFFSNSENDINNDVECPENCLDKKCDNETLKCDSCIDGFYSDKCDKDCPLDHCKKCEQNEGSCIECELSYHLVDDFCCNSNCNKCDKNGCYDCASKEKYGTECIDCANTCDNNGDGRKCDQVTGKCYKCQIGRRGDECTENCNKGCDLSENNCGQDDGKCSCQSGYFGDTCDGECDRYCKDCDKIDGTCNECQSGYYINPEDEKQCIKCPENCDGECPKGICEKCKDSFYGDICDQNCSKNCLNNKCDKVTGKCQCINFYSEDSDCSECKYFFDLKTSCTECITNYNRTENCTKCIFNFDINKGCTECLEHFTLESYCQQCINHYDIEQNCKYCQNHYDITTDCQSCETNYDINSLCKNCRKNYDLSQNCEKCINHYDVNKDCLQCEENYDIDKQCQQCLKNYDISQNCEKCINSFDIESGCTTCLVGYFGTQCNKQCYAGCNTTESNCQQSDGKCENCIRGYFNEYCSEKCYEHCLGEPYTCNPKTGECEKCEPLYFGAKCESKTAVDHCIEVNKTGTCIKCENTYYLSKGLCLQCSSNCNDNLCEDNTGKCYSCSNINTYGTYCEQYCSKFCQQNGTGYICDRESGSCFFGCVSTGHFVDDKCKNCEQGFYPIDYGCNLECSDNCENKLLCKENDGSCETCKVGYWGIQCTENCDETCKKRECQKEDGVCNDCIDGYYKKNDKCEKCPPNCNTCSDENKCISCIDNYYGEEKCEKKCSSHCEGKTCEIKNGNCNCDSKYFGEKCDNECIGCSENGCEDKEGICNDHYCLDNYYDPRKCNKKCSENCQNEKCDTFTGECISCPENRWGKLCEKTCSNECKDDGRVDCCYIKAHEHDKPKGIEIEVTYKVDNVNNEDLKEEQNEFSFIYLTLGGYKLKILVDFETNSPLVVFDSDTTITIIETDIYRIYYNKTYKSSSSDCIKGESFDGFYEYEGFFLSKEISAKDTLEINGHIFSNFSFLICQEFKIAKDFENAGTIDGIIGLGLRSYFSENLFYTKEDEFPKNILIKFYDEQKKTTSIYFGDYLEKIKNNFSKLSTLIIENKQSIVMDQLITFETKFTGIAYSLRKAYHYQYDKKVILNNRIETTIVFNNLYQQFFEKIYFGDLYENGCYDKNLGGEKEYYCEKGKKSQIQNLPKLGLILGDYIYYLSFNFLYKESENYFTFIIKLHGQGQQKIELGKSFFNEFSIIYNNGNETLNFYGDIKKLNVPLKDPSNLLNIDSDIFTPGGWVTLIVFITVLIIIFCYLIKYCGEKTDNEDEEDDDMDYEDDSLIDDTLE